MIWKLKLNKIVDFVECRDESINIVLYIKMTGVFL